jgi:hypothetical protein
VTDAIPIARLLLFRFCLPERALFRFFHSPTVYGFLHARLGTRPGQELPAGIRLLAVESGRVRYAPGDTYHVAIALSPGAAIGTRELVARLGRHGTARHLDGTPLGPRTSLVGVTDLVSGGELANGGEAEPLTLAALKEPIGRIAGTRTLRLRFDSPLLILRQPVQRRDTFMDGEVFDPAVLLERAGRAAHDGWPTLAEPLPVPGAKLAANHLVRAETYYRGASPTQAGKILPGATGQVVIELAEPLGEDWALRLLLAGLYGAGKSTAMGQGRFTVHGVPVHPRWPPPAASTFCQRMARPEMLTRAREALGHAGATPGVDDVERDEFLDALTFRQPLLAEALSSGEHRPAALRGLLLARPDGKVRPLAIPTLEDRFLQRAAVEELGPAFDELLEESSFAYRRGLSRRNAEQRIRRAHDEGYKHVLEADLRAFFDRVDWDILRRRLEAYLGEDPAVDLLMRWVRAPVEFGDQLIRRKQGLPQGTELSPMLAKLCLDFLNELVEREGHFLVRRGDDFLVLSKHPTGSSSPRSTCRCALRTQPHL